MSWENLFCDFIVCVCMCVCLFLHNSFIDGIEEYKIGIIEKQNNAWTEINGERNDLATKERLWKYANDKIWFKKENQ